MPILNETPSCLGEIKREFSNPLKTPIIQEILKEFDEKFPLPLEVFHKAYWDKPDKDGNSMGIPAKITDETNNVKSFLSQKLEEVYNAGKKDGYDKGYEDFKDKLG